MIDRKKFFEGIKSGGPFAKVTDGQVDGINRILDEWERRKLTDLRWLANMLGQVKWESANTMQPVREYGGEKYLKTKKYYPWVGEGLIQVTHKVNHAKFGATTPGQMMTWPIALRALFDGMISGMFTGKKLSDYFNATKTDWVNARRIVNGTDKAVEIATISKQFYADLMASDMKTTPIPVVIVGSTPAPTPAPVPPEKDAATAGKIAAGSAVIIAAGTGAGAAVQQGVDALTVGLWIGGLSAVGVAAIVIGYRIIKGAWPWTSIGVQSQEPSPPSPQSSEPSSGELSAARLALLSAASPAAPSPQPSELKKPPKRSVRLSLSVPMRRKLSAKSKPTKAKPSGKKPLSKSKP